MTRTYHPDGIQPQPGQVFVFGSNLSGHHGGGAARAAHQNYGAEWGVAEGRTGRCYAIPTVNVQISGPRPLESIAHSVRNFLSYAEWDSKEQFFVTRIGCGLAGHKDADIAPMFANAPANCSLPDTWRDLLGKPQAVEVV